jgi:RNA-dependent RNA polymerase
MTLVSDVYHCCYHSYLHGSAVLPPYDKANSKPPACAIATDGCGMVNPVTLQAIQEYIGGEHHLSAAQVRTVGSKGLLALATHDDPIFAEVEPKILIAHSQQKIALQKIALHNNHLYTPFTRAQYMLNLVAPNKVTSPARLNMQAIMNLSHNGVPDSIFKDLLRTGLESHIRPLLTWDGTNAMTLLWKAVEGEGRVSGARVRRSVGGQSRAFGFGQRFSKDEEDDAHIPDGPPEDIPENSYLDYDTISSRSAWTGEPITKAEQILEMLQAGFEPLKCPALAHRLETFISWTIEGCVREYHIPVPLSAEAWVIPGMFFTYACVSDPKKLLLCADYYEVLEEGQIYFNPTGELGKTLQGQMLVSFIVV